MDSGKDRMHKCGMSRLRQRKIIPAARTPVQTMARTLQKTPTASKATPGRVSRFMARDAMVCSSSRVSKECARDPGFASSGGWWGPG